MGWFTDKRTEAAEQMRQVATSFLGPGEPLVASAYAMRPSRMSAKNYVIAIADERIVLVEVDRKMNPAAPAVSLTPPEISVGNIFADGAAWSGGSKGQEIRFEAGGEKYRFTMLGGNFVENTLAGDEQTSGVEALVEFLRRCPT